MACQIERKIGGNLKRSDCQICGLPNLAVWRFLLCLQTGRNLTFIRHLDE